MCAGVPGGSLEGPWGSLGSLGCLRSGIPSKPKQIKRTYCFLIYLKIFSYYCVGQTIQLLWRVGLILGPLWGTYPLSAIVLLHFLMQFLIRKPMFFLMAFSWFFFDYFEFHLMSFIFPLMAFMFPQIYLYFLQFSLISFMFLFKIQNLSVFGKM